MSAVALLNRLRKLGVRLRAGRDGLAFDDPAGVVDDALKQEIRRHEAAIVALLGPAAPRSAPPESTRTPAGDAPLSFEQERLWLLAQLEPDAPTYNVGLLLRLDGSLDRGALRRALDEVVRRHEVLRTAFAIVGGEARQRVLASPRFEVRTVDVGGESEAVEAARAAASAPFDLDRGDVFRALVLRASDELNWLLLAAHHVVVDAWSYEPLLGEVAALYGAFSSGRPSPLAELPIQYSEFASSQRRTLTPEALEPHLAYWRDRLHGLEALDLPTDRRRSEDPGARGFTVDFALPPAASERVRTLAASCRATPFIVLMAGLDVLLHRVTGQADIAVGFPVSSRDRVELGESIGLFVNTLVLRCDLGGEPSFRAVLDQVRSRVVEALDHQSVPFSRLVEALAPPRVEGVNPFFEVMLDHAEEPLAPPPFGAVSVSAVPLDLRTAKFDLTFVTAWREDALVGSINAAEALFERESVARLAARFVRLIEAATADPDLPIGELPLMPAEERRIILAEWSGRRVAGAADRCLHDLVRARAAQSPEATAVVSGGRDLTYRELIARSGTVATALRGMGVRRGTPVALLTQRTGADEVAALLGVLEAGGAAVPLDPGWPRLRLASVLERCRPAVVVSDAEHALAARATELPVLSLGEIAPVSAGRAGAGHDSPEPGDLAYVIYTSGSTGVPKGVEVEHRAAANEVVAMADLVGMSARDRALRFFPLTADPAIEEIFSALSSGAALVCPVPGMIDSPRRFLEACRALRVTVVNLPTGFWHVLTDEIVQDGLRLPDGLHTVIIGTEGADAARVGAWHRAVGPAVRLLNGYGPTEGTITATVADLRGCHEHAAAVPIGRPLPGVRVYVVDPRGEPVPTGVPGELWIGGLGVARGYRGEPSLTAERFTADPFAGVPGGRVYRTGDRARWRGDGQLEFLGRLDDQLEVRGFRVEPAEIVAVLVQHPDVAQAAVAGTADGTGSQTLAAYVVPRRSPGPSPEELRAFVGARLPSFMVPATFTALGRLPRTASGKLDRKALPAGGAAARAEGGEPSPGLERAVAEVFGAVLKVAPIGAETDFFAAGGHSLLAVRLVGRLAEVTQAPIALRDLFAAPTPRRLAARLEGRTREPARQPEVRDDVPVAP